MIFIYLAKKKRSRQKKTDRDEMKFLKDERFTKIVYKNKKKKARAHTVFFLFVNSRTINRNSFRFCFRVR